MSAKKKTKLEKTPLLSTTSALKCKVASSEREKAKKTVQLFEPTELLLHSQAVFPKTAGYASAQPFPHGHVEPLMNISFYEALRREVKSLHHTRKETDLFKLSQSPDLKNLDFNKEIQKQVPNLLQLRSLLYSQSFRTKIEIAAGLQKGTLVERTDLASSIYTKGDHLLMHDDVIGTRVISFIVYLTDSPWTEKDGGLLELFGHAGDRCKDTHRPNNVPQSALLPTGNSMSFFTVRAGVSYHAVSEVRAAKPRQRISLQGWYHGLKSLSPLHAPPSRDLIKSILSVDWISASEDQQSNANLYNCTSLPILDIYLKPESTAGIMRSLLSNSVITLRDFLKKPPLLPNSLKEIKDYLDSSTYQTNRGINPIVERFMQVPPLVTASNISHFVNLLLTHVTGMEFVAQSHPIGRLFRRGMDYTVGTAPKYNQCVNNEFYLYWTYCHVKPSNLWEEGEYGGFECIMPAEEENNPEVVAAYDPEADANDVYNFEPSPNTLSLALTKGRDLRFIKFLSSDAPSNRLDTTGVIKLRVTASEGGDE